jgi:S1-C subfamily serine protease
MSRFWHHFVSNGRGARSCGRLGVHGYAAPILRSRARQFQLQQVSGVEIWRVEPGSPAARAGILEGDILVMLAEEPTVNMNRLRKMLRRLPLGFPAEVAWLRGESQMRGWVIPGYFARHARKAQA